MSEKLKLVGEEAPTSTCNHNQAHIQPMWDFLTPSLMSKLFLLSLFFFFFLINKKILLKRQPKYT